MLMLWGAPRRRLTGRDPLIVDAGDLMNRPEDTIRAYCAHVGIDFRPHALRWQPSDRPEWQGGFSRWFTDVAASSGLAEPPSRRGLDADQHPLLGTYLAYHLPFYQELHQRRLMVLGNWPRTQRCTPPMSPPSWSRILPLTPSRRLYRVTLGFLCIYVAGRSFPLMPAGPWLGDFPALRLFHLMTGPAAGAGIAAACTTALIVRNGMLKIADSLAWREQVGKVHS